MHSDAGLAFRNHSLITVIQVTLNIPLSHELRSERVSERSGERERSQQCGASEIVSGESE